MLNAKEIEYLLDTLCREMGFCLPPDDQNRLQENPPNEVKAFTDEIFFAEGLDPQYVRRDLYRAVMAKVTEAFQKEEE